MGLKRSQPFTERVIESLPIVIVVGTRHGLHMRNDFTSTFNDELDDSLIEPSFTVVAVHDTLAGEARVNQAFDWLYQSFKADVSMVFQSWSLAKLEVPNIRSMAIHSAADADIILFVTSGGLKPTEQLKRWLESVMHHQREYRALLVTLSDDVALQSADLDSMCSFIQLEAQRWRTSSISCHHMAEPRHRQILLRQINRKLQRSNEEDEEDLKNTSHAEPIQDTNLSDFPKSIRDYQGEMKTTDIHKIRELAYDLWIQEGRPAGREIDFWLRAEHQLQAAAQPNE